jgi:large subunit ribosomal protein L24
MRKIRKGDTVVVTAGRDKGRTGTVVNVLSDGRVLVENVNMIKKHQRPNPGKGVQGAIVQKEAPLHVSNVALLNPATGKGGRVGVRSLKDGRKVRFFKSNGEMVDA